MLSLVGLNSEILIPNVFKDVIHSKKGSPDGLVLFPNWTWVLLTSTYESDITIKRDWVGAQPELSGQGKYSVLLGLRLLFSTKRNLGRLMELKKGPRHSKCPGIANLFSPRSPKTLPTNYHWGNWGVSVGNYHHSHYSVRHTRESGLDNITRDQWEPSSTR